MPSQVTPSGSASVSGIAVLENPRQQNESPKTPLFDTHLFCPVNTTLKINADNEIEDDEGKKSHTPGILASLHYFNSRDLHFDEVEAYFITANVCFYISLIFSNVYSLAQQVVKVLEADAKDLPNIASPELTNNDYSLVGDIVSVCNDFIIFLDINSVDFIAYPCISGACLQSFCCPCIRLPHSSQLRRTIMHPHIRSGTRAIHPCL